MILVIGQTDDIHVALVMRRLAEKGASAVCFDVLEAPARCRISAWLDGGGPLRAVLGRPQGDVDLAAVRTVWVRRLTDPCPYEELSPEDREFAASEVRSFLWSLAVALRDRFWVNPLVEGMATDRGNGKISQLEAARRIGLEIPRTLATNDPDAAREFIASCPQGAVYKAFTAPTRSLGRDGERERWGTVLTTRIDERALGKLDVVRHAPCLFQELLPKQLDLRITAMGEKVMATAIHSQVHEKSAVDFRRRYALGQTPYSAYPLPRAVEKGILALNRALGLVFGAYDFVLTQDGRHVFLEVNEQGQFLWLEAMTGQPLLENFCEMLIQARPDFCCDAEAHPPGPFPRP